MFNVPLSRMLNVCAVPDPLNDRFAEIDAEPVTSRAVNGAVLPMPISVALGKLTVAFRIDAVPVVPPIVRVVAAPAKSTVVAVVLIRAKVVDPVVREVVIAGEVPNTLTPEPVSSVKASRRAADKAVAAKFEDASVNKALDAVKPVNVTVLLALKVPVISRVVPGAVFPIPTLPEF